jgi:hypothetical protein
MYTITLNELKAVFDMSAQSGQSGTVYKTSEESTAQDAFQEVKRRKRHISSNASQTAMK